MDEKTERLRDIFLEVAEDTTVTERQEESRGSLLSDEAVDDRLSSIIGAMRERYDFRTSLEDAALVTVVRGWFEGRNDTEIARDLGDASLSKTVSRARIDLHLVADRDLDPPFDLDDLREAIGDGLPMTAVADQLDVSESTVRRYRHIAEVQDERRTIGDRFREEFERVLEDRELSDRMTEEIRRTGLEEATEDMETNVSF